ncbi:uncharacterized protein I303_104784 [Kwoniella dejecticola CBS 10117]|uniref:Uncharacterized protein n=1 Tax=Kwoniella dejecticola CBS 10117 TaxID=1296121 RepID=A0A1A6A4C8_9TREE|nr:uncharacterized protein I303_04235 [Kwoniella dejecticola CBS 10117]OBR84912.1 hypothetical protein I303_04235 [Kwoniella dejecticola CBS 10117]
MSLIIYDTVTLGRGPSATHAQSSFNHQYYVRYRPEDHGRPETSRDRSGIAPTARPWKKTHCHDTHVITTMWVTGQQNPPSRTFNRLSMLTTPSGGPRAVAPINLDVTRNTSNWIRNNSEALKRELREYSGNGQDNDFISACDFETATFSAYSDAAEKASPVGIDVGLVLEGREWFKDTLGVEKLDDSLHAVAREDNFTRTGQTVNAAF